MQEETRNVQGEAPVQNQAQEEYQDLDTREQSAFEAAPEQSAPSTGARWSVDQDELLNPYEDDPIPEDQLLNPYEDDPIPEDQLLNPYEDDPIPEDELLNPYEEDPIPEDQLLNPFASEMILDPLGGADPETFWEAEVEGRGYFDDLPDLGIQDGLYAAIETGNSPGPFINNPPQPQHDPWDPPAATGPAVPSGPGHDFPVPGEVPYGNVEGPDYFPPPPPPAVEVPVEVVVDIVEVVGEDVGEIFEDIGDVFGF